MSEDQPSAGDEPRAEDLSDELAKKYDPERLLKIVSRRAGKGQALDHSVRSKYEKQFGVDLGHVRLITGEFAEEFNRQRNAYAVTIGGTGLILMGNSPDKAMGTTAGEALLAHELTHVAQAQRGLHRKAYDGDMPFGGEHDEIEAEAEAVEAQEQGLTQDDREQKADDDLEADLEKIKKRVFEMAAEAARTRFMRSGRG
jgi:hypothetical protein